MTEEQFNFFVSPLMSEDEALELMGLHLNGHTSYGRAGLSVAMSLDQAQEIEKYKNKMRAKHHPGQFPVIKIKSIDFPSLASRAVNSFKGF